MSVFVICIYHKASACHFRVSRFFLNISQKWKILIPKEMGSGWMEKGELKTGDIRMSLGFRWESMDTGAHVWIRKKIKK